MGLFDRISGFFKRKVIQPITEAIRGAPKEAQMAFPVGVGLTPEQTGRAEQVTGIQPSFGITGPAFQQGVVPSAQPAFQQPTRNIPEFPSPVTGFDPRIEEEREQQEERIRRETGKFIQTQAATPFQPSLGGRDLGGVPSRIPIPGGSTLEEAMRIVREAGGGTPVSPTGFVGMGGIPSPTTGVSFDPTGRTGITGGAAMLPGSLGSPFRTAGGGLSFLLSEEEEKRRREKVKQGMPLLERESFTLAPRINPITGLVEGGGIEPMLPTPTPSPLSIEQQQAGLNRFTSIPGTTREFNPFTGEFREREEVSPFAIRGGIDKTQEEALGLLRGAVVPKQLPSGGVGFELTPEDFRTAPLITSEVTLKPNQTESEAEGVIENNLRNTFVQNNEIRDTRKKEALSGITQSVIQQSGGQFGNRVFIREGIDVFELDPTTFQLIPHTGTKGEVTLQEFKSSGGLKDQGLNLEILPSSSEISDMVSRGTEEFISDEGNILTFEDFEIGDDADRITQDELDVFDNQVQIIKDKLTEAGFDPGFIDVTEIFTDAMAEQGVPKLKADRKKIKDDVAALEFEFGKLSDEVREDPDFSKTLKQRRLEFIDSKKLRQLEFYQTQLNNIENLITDRVNTAKDLLNTRIKTFELAQNEINNIRKAREDFIKGIEKADEALKDDVRAIATTLINNPALAKDLTSSEINFITKNGIYPQSVIAKIGATLGTKLSNVFHQIDNSGNLRVFGVDTNNNLVNVSNVPGFKVLGAADDRKIITREATDPITGQTITQTIDITDPTNPIIVGEVGRGLTGQLTATRKQQLFLSYLSQVWRSKSKKQLESEAGAEGLSLEDKDIRSGINDAADTRLRIHKEPTFEGTFTEYIVSLAKTGDGQDGEFSVILQDPNTGQQFGYKDSNDPEIQQALSAGYIKIK